MNYSNCSLYGVQSKKVLAQRLHISDKRYFKQSFVSSHIHPYIEQKNGKKRLIEPPDAELKRIQKQLKNRLSELDIPPYVFSGVKGRSYVDNAKVHSGMRYVYKLDISGFFPSTPRERAYTFFRRKLGTSPDVAECLSNFVTVNLDLADCKNPSTINDFLQGKNIQTRNHLISGSPTSQILSYLMNEDMFNQLNNLAKKQNMEMTIYVDDVTFSSEQRISPAVQTRIVNILHRFGFLESKGKIRLYSKHYPKLITGTTISDEGKCVIRNSISYRIMKDLAELKRDPANQEVRRRLQGLVSAARQVDPQAFPSVRRYAYKKLNSTSEM